MIYPIIIHVEEVIDPTPLHIPPDFIDSDDSDDKEVTRRHVYSS
jgi:hypothetical protein